MAILLANQATTAPSPGPTTVATPCSSTRQTDSSLDDHLAHRVTSSSRPSVYLARTTIGWAWPTRWIELAGQTSIDSTRGSSSTGGLAPAAIHSAKIR